jgi:DNA-binding CsgD family transcriptional regulator
MIVRMTAAVPPALQLPLDGAMVSRLARTAATVGSDAFDAALIGVLRGICQFDTCGVMDYHLDRPPHQRLHEVNESLRAVPHDAYLSGPYALDPMYRHYLAGAPDGLYPLAAIAPDDFEASEYHHIFHAHIGICDEVNLMCLHADGRATVVFIERRVGASRFAPADLWALELAWPLLRELMQLHARHQVSRPPSASDTLTHRQVQRTLAHFGRSLLTDRERQVLFHMLGGYSATLTAQRLGVAEGTVKNHRKSVHRKLDVRSQAELFSLFINCIPYAGSGAADDATDPLAIYQSRPGKH